ncbi:MAG: hypothetical protein K6T83_22405, partial [Alicyclobacillus sp.]|nr:hypothetical protein [Alicyclobacillus sp.]
AIVRLAGPNSSAKKMKRARPGARNVCQMLVMTAAMLSMAMATPAFAATSSASQAAKASTSKPAQKPAGGLDMYRQLLTSSSNAPYQQIHIVQTFHMKLNDAKQPQQMTFHFDAALNVQKAGKSFLESGTITETGDGTKQTMHIFARNGIEYVNVGQGWQQAAQLNSATSSQLLQSAKSAATKVTMTKTKNGHQFVVQESAAALSSMAQQLLSSVSTAGNTAQSNKIAVEILKQAHVRVVATSAKVGGVERIVRDDLDMNIHLSNQLLKQLGMQPPAGSTDGSTGSSNTVTGSVYGTSGSTSSSSKDTMDLTLQESVSLSYQHVPVKAPAGLPKM